MGFWVTLGDTCSEKVEKPFIIKADYLKGMVIAKRKRFIWDM